MDEANRKALEEAKRLLREAGKVPPKVRFERLVKRGLIDRQGRLTRLAGGDAEPDPSYQPATESS